MGDQLADEAKPGYKGTKTSAACGAELSRFKIGRSENINADLPLAKACKADADKLCANKYDVRAQCQRPPVSPPAACATILHAHEASLAW